MLSDDYEQGQEQPLEKLLQLMPMVLNDTVKAVYVHAQHKSKEYKEQQIDISYDLVGIFPAAMLNGLQKVETAEPKLRRLLKTFLCCFMSAALRAVLFPPQESFCPGKKGVVLPAGNV